MITCIYVRQIKKNGGKIMFPYHNRAKQLIKEGHLIRYEFVEKWNHIANALVLYFNNHRPIPIRDYRHNEYMPLLEGVELCQINKLDTDFQKTL